jgi:hypothetical protein
MTLNANAEFRTADCEPCTLSLFSHHIVCRSAESRGALVSAITNAHTNAIFASSRLNYNQDPML